MLRHINNQIANTSFKGSFIIVKWKKKPTIISLLITMEKLYEILIQNIGG